MNDIVTELPVFAGTAGVARGNEPPRMSASIRSGGRPQDSTGPKRAANPWLMLAILVIVVVASLLILSIYAQHLTRNHNTGLPRPSVATRSVSGLRL